MKELENIKEKLNCCGYDLAIFSKNNRITAVLSFNGTNLCGISSRLENVVSWAERKLNILKNM